jgi:hypothetical protein
MEIEVEPTKWKLNCNRGPPRPQSSMKEKEVFKQVTKMLELKVIRPATAVEYSQVLLTPKPEDKWRFVLIIDD